MALAYRNMFYPLRHIPNDEEARILNIQIYERATDSPGERKGKTREMLKSGELGAHWLEWRHVSCHLLCLLLPQKNAVCTMRTN